MSDDVQWFGGDTGLRDILENERVLMVALLAAHDDYKCPHTVGNVVPRALRVPAEDGYYNAYICFDCLLEWATAHADLLRAARDEGTADE